MKKLYSLASELNARYILDICPEHAYFVSKEKNLDKKHLLQSTIDTNNFKIHKYRSIIRFLMYLDYGILLTTGLFLLGGLFVVVDTHIIINIPFFAIGFLFIIRSIYISIAINLFDKMYDIFNFNPDYYLSMQK